MQQIVEYKNDPGNGYTRTPLYFVTTFTVGKGEKNTPRHFSVDADDRFLPVYQQTAKHKRDFASGCADRMGGC
jgi:type I restriction enzyme, R subunit